MKKRFVQWVRDACSGPHDQNWLDYQEEIGLRHTPDQKNVTDHAHTPSLVPLRYLYGFVPVVALSARKLFVDGGVAGEELQKSDTPPQSGWLDELGRLKGGRPICPGVALSAPNLKVQNCPLLPSALSCSRMYMCT